MRQVTHALLTRPPLSHSSNRSNQSASLDLHVLSTPPAFILSQDQTLVKSVCFWSKSLASNFVTLLTVLVLFLNCSLASNCTCTRKRCFLVYVASPNPHSCKRLKVNFHRFHLVRQFSAFRNFQECLFCHLLFNYQCSFAILRQLN